VELDCLAECSFTGRAELRDDRSYSTYQLRDLSPDALGQPRPSHDQGPAEPGLMTGVRVAWSGIAIHEDDTTIPGAQG
jgi:hypothetical protein